MSDNCEVFKRPETRRLSISTRSTFPARSFTIDSFELAPNLRALTDRETMHGYDRLLRSWRIHQCQYGHYSNAINFVRHLEFDLNVSV